MSKIDNFGEKRNTAGFLQHPENINPKGRITIKTQLKELVDSEHGEIFIKKSDIIETTSEGVLIRVTNKEAIALKLMDWINSSNGQFSLKAIEMVMNRIDGMPKQSIENVEPPQNVIVNISTTE